MNIGLVGPMGSGKTTAANRLVDAYGYRRIALADPLKDVSVKMIQVFMEEMNRAEPLFTRKELDDNKDPHFRPFLQWVGTDLGRVYLGPDTIWIDKFLETAQYSDQPVVCDDVRFVNEAEALRDAGFTIIRIIRDEAQMLSYQAGVVNNHVSERDMGAIEEDITLFNHGGPDFYDAIDNLWREYEYNKHQEDILSEYRSSL